MHSDLKLKEEITPHPDREILVVDDDDTFRDRVVRALVNRGYRAFGASGMSDAVARAQSIPPDCIFLDLRLGRENGLDVLPEIKQAAPQARIIILTGYGSIATAVAALQQGAADYLTKPVNIEHIIKYARGIKTGVPAASQPDPIPPLDRVEWEHIHRVLQDCDGNISRAAALLGIHRRSLQRKLAKRPFPTK
jgi:two-component system response regulator RegA